jgi:hypothetical protein
MRKVLIIATLTSGFLLVVGLGMSAWWQYYAEQRIFLEISESTISGLEKISDPDVLRKGILMLAHQKNDISKEANSLLGNSIDLLLAICLVGFVSVWACVLSAAKMFYKEKDLKLGWLKWL